MRGEREGETNFCHLKKSVRKSFLSFPFPTSTFGPNQSIFPYLLAISPNEFLGSQTICFFKQSYFEKSFKQILAIVVCTTLPFSTPYIKAKPDARRDDRVLQLRRPGDGAGSAREEALQDHGPREGGQKGSHGGVARRANRERYCT